jgi:hypothetical protein
MYLRSDIPLDGSFQEYDLAYSNEDYSKWTPMNARVWFNAEGLICGVLPAPYPTTLTTIFPVWRYRSPPLPLFLAVCRMLIVFSMENAGRAETGRERRSSRA